MYETVARLLCTATQRVGADTDRVAGFHHSKIAVNSQNTADLEQKIH
jgi:hypothetical protein